MSKRFEQAFLDGYKLSILLLKSSRYYEDVKDYPCVAPFSSHPESCIFFQSERLKQEYEIKIKGVEEDSYAYHYIVGRALGYPEQSVDFYARMRAIEAATGEESEEEQCSLGINWAGFQFATPIHHLVHDIEWLWRTYKHPLSITEELRIVTKDYKHERYVPYGDMAQLHKAKEQLEELQPIHI